VGVGEVDPGAGDVDHDLVVAGHRVGHVEVPQHLRPPELLDLNRAHRSPHY